MSEEPLQPAVGETFTLPRDRWFAFGPRQPYAYAVVDSVTETEIVLRWTAVPVSLRPQIHIGEMPL